VEEGKMSSNAIKVAVVAILLVAGAAVAQKLFHEQSSVTSNITFSSRSFSVNGEPTWIFAGEVEYWRVPRELWRDRLMRVKRAGYNTVSFYVFWNLHEPVEGQFHYEDNLDIDAWMALIKEFGMYAIPRVGPYDCAEVDFGGFPPWLVDIPNIKIRGTDAQYLQRVDAYFESIFPIITKHQINKGGAVIVVQIENEHYPAGGAYQTHLVDKAKALGMVVPYIWSDIYNGSSYDPGAFPDLATKGFMTEQWMGWISRYGEPSATDAAGYNNQTWRMLACGSGGTSHYMAHGGTNFGYTAAPDQRITSYDYGSQIGELGQIRPVLYSVKQCGWLANTFGPLFANSTNGAAEVSGLPTGLVSYAQTSTAGKAAMVTGGAGSMQITWKNKGITVPSTGSWSLQSGNCAHFLADVPITGNVTLDYSATGILCRKKLGNKNYLVLYGSTGNSGGDIAFVYKTAPTSAPSSPWTWNAASKRASLRFTYPTTDTVNEVVLDEGTGQTINLLVMSNSMSNRTWVTDNDIVCGAAFVGEKDTLHFPAAGGKAYIFSGGSMMTVVKAAATGQSAKSFSSGWSWIASPEVGASYNDASWKQSQTAQTMTSYGWPNGYGWYRATYNATSAGTATLAIPNISGTVIVFANGTWAGTSTNQSITLKQGANSIAILASAAERDKMFNTFNYAPPDKCRSGIWGNITIGGTSVGPWRFRGGFEGVDESPMMGTISAASWTSLLAKSWSTGTPASDNIPRLWRMDFTYTPPENGVQTWTLKGTVTSGSQGVVWFNGYCLGRQITNQPALFVPECWLAANNTIIVLTQDGSAPQGYSLQPVEYRSFAMSPLVGVHQKSGSETAVPRQAKSVSTMVVSGNTCSLPGYRGNEGSLAIYDVRGRLLERNMAIQKGMPELKRRGAAMANGVFIVRMKE
jgi:beta-galactosidase